MRQPRQQCESDTYHVMVRGVGRQLIFEDDADRNAFLRLLRGSTERENVSIYAYCLMGNHVHLLLHGNLDAISRCMHRICGVYAQLYNRRHDRVGHLFQDRYRSEPVENDEYLLTVVRYIHQNPLKAGLSKSCRWPWSSYDEYCGYRAGKPLASTQFVMTVFGNHREFLRFHKSIDFGARCLEISEDSHTNPRALADKILGAGKSAALGTLERAERDAGIAQLLSVGLSVRQIAQLTGIGKSTIARVPHDRRDAGVRHSVPLEHGAVAAL